MRVILEKTLSKGFVQSEQAILWNRQGFKCGDWTPSRDACLFAKVPRGGRARSVLGVLSLNFPSGKQQSLWRLLWFPVSCVPRYCWCMAGNNVLVHASSQSAHKPNRKGKAETRMRAEADLVLSECCVEREKAFYRIFRHSSLG